MKGVLQHKYTPATVKTEGEVHENVADCEPCTTQRKTRWLWSSIACMTELESPVMFSHVSFDAASCAVRREQLVAQARPR
jgi:hypothetical protein